MSTFATRSAIARRAVATRQARQYFRETYPETAGIAEDIIQGATNSYIAWNYDVPVSSIAAVRANLNRNSDYAWAADDCNF